MERASTLPDTQPLQESLERLERCESFARSSGLMQLLQFIAANMQDAEVLKETYIGTVFYGRPANYDPQLDSIVRVNMNRLCQRLEEYYAKEGRDNPYRIEITRGSYRPIVLPQAPAKPPMLYIVDDSELPVLPPSLLHRLKQLPT